MKLTFLGAAHEVTGSRFLLEACGKTMLIDYGMEQGKNIYENMPLPMPALAVDAVFLTHAHIDHSGWLPLLKKQGFHGTVYATEATKALCGIMLMDSAHIQEMEVAWDNRKAQRSGKALKEPLYTQQDATDVLKLFAGCKYDEETPIWEGISIRFVDAGHLLGSASIEVTVVEDGQAQTLVFSGDIGNINQPLLKDPHYCTKADYVIMEATYGDRSHSPVTVTDSINNLASVLQTTFDRGGNVVIPSFAVGRTQEMLYFIRAIKEQGLVKGHEQFTVYVDSPLAIEATRIFNESGLANADEETLALIRDGINPISFEGLKVSVGAEESKLINDDHAPKVIISASGMCDAGRIRHHLKHNLWRPECTILFVGYQSMGTMGRSLVDGAEDVRLFGETIRVHAEIKQMAGISGHADNHGLMKWVGSFEEKPRHVFVVHGEDSVTTLFAERIQQELQWSANAPYNGECWDLTTCAMLREGNRQKVEKLQKPVAEAGQEATRPAAAKETAKKEDLAPGSEYGKLLHASQTLAALIGRMRGRSQKDMDKLTKQINALCRRFDKRSR